jgi:nitric oxide reductase large subunit
VQGDGGWASGFEGVPLMTRKKRHIYLLIIVIVAVVVLVVVWGAILPKLEGDFLTLRGHQGIAMYFRFSGEI